MGGLLIAALVQAWYPVEVELWTDSDWARVEIAGAEAWLDAPRIEAPEGLDVRVEGLNVAKKAFDATPVTVRTRAWLRPEEDALRLVMEKGDIGSMRVTVRQGEEVRIAAENAGDAPGDPRNRIDRVVLLGRLAAGEGPSPVARRRRAGPHVLAFYYPWYGTPEGPSGRWSHWDPGHMHNASAHTPVLGAYDSHDPAVIRRHIQWAREAGVDGFIASWWGPGDFTDRALAVILDVADAEGFLVTAYLEQAGDATAYARQLAYLRERYGDRASWLKVGERPVVFVYGRVVGDLGLDALAAARPRDLFLVGDTLDPDGLCAFDGLHTYNPVFESPPNLAARYRALADADGLLAATVAPGYDDRAVREPGGVADRRDGLTYDRFWEAARLGSPDWVLVTSWNEWHEGSEIEPSEELGEEYLERTRRWADAFRSAQER